jgi:hypothetical protein
MDRHIKTKDLLVTIAIVGVRRRDSVKFVESSFLEKLYGNVPRTQTTRPLIPSSDSVYQSEIRFSRPNRIQLSK